VGGVPGDLGHFQQRIDAGLKRLEGFQYEDGLFAIWCGGAPGIDITARVAHRLLGFGGLPFDAAHAMRDRAARALQQKRYRDNLLLPLGPHFRAPLKTVADAVALYFHGDGGRDEALAFLRHSAEPMHGGTARWPADERHYWGGALEATCDAARVMRHAGDPLFLPGFRYVAGKLVNGMLYSTADTRALVELLADLDYPASQTALVDGQEIPLRDTPSGREVTALTDNLIVRVDRTIEINHLEPRSDFRFALEPSKTRLRLGERIQISVTPKEPSIAPLVRLYLPGCLALLKGGANAQTAHLPVEREALTVDAVGVRPGKGRLYASVHDMYDADKVGTAPGIEIRVE
jgi:hypothetical protein